MDQEEKDTTKSASEETPKELVEDGQELVDLKTEEVVADEAEIDEAPTIESESRPEDVGKDKSEPEKVEEDIDEAPTNESESRTEGIGKEIESIAPKFNLGDINKQTGDRGWYVIHTYAGYEEQVAENLRQRIDTLKLHDKIFDVIVPKEKQIEIKNGKRKVVEKRIFPGYVIVDMIVTDYSWYIVRNTPNVTGFIGLGVRPTPMDQVEIDRIKKRMGVEEPKYKVDLRLDDLVRINDGPLKGFEGKVTEVDEAKGKIKVSVSMFGRETPVNLDFLQVKKM